MVQHMKFLTGADPYVLDYLYLGVKNKTDTDN